MRVVNLIAYEKEGGMLRLWRTELRFHFRKGIPMRMKSTGLALVVTLLVGLLAGCGGESQNNSSGGQATNKGTSSSASAPQQEVTLQFHAWLDESFVQPIIAEFEKRNPGIKVNYNLLAEGNDSEAAMKKLDLLIASGEKVDVLLFPGVTDYAKRAALDMLAPLNDFIKEEGLNFNDEYIVDTSINGTYYGLPDTFESKLVILNKDMLDKANLPVPKNWTWDDFADYAKKLTFGEGASKVYGTYFHTWPLYWQLALINQPQHNGLVVGDKANIDNEFMRKSLEIRYRTEHIDHSSIPYSETISQKLAYRNIYFGQRAAMIPTGNWMVAEVGGSDKFPATFKTAFELFPKNKPDDPDGVVDANGNFIAIAARSQNQDAAYKFIRFYTTEGEEMGNLFSAWKKQDLNKKIDTIFQTVQSPDMIDRDSLVYVLQNTKPAPINIPPSYQSDVESAVISEGEKFFLIP
mgnify:CR=1 FL=1